VEVSALDESEENEVLNLPAEDEDGNFHMLKMEDILYVSSVVPGDMDTMAVFHTADKIYFPIHSDKASRQYAEYLNVPYDRE
jgi:hypothetical protein